MKKMVFILVFLILCQGVLSARPDTVQTEADGREAVNRARQEIARLGMTIDRDILVRVESADAIRTHFSNSGRSGSSVFAFYQPHSPESIWIPLGHSKSSLVPICAHELTHAWQSTNCPPQDRALKEGFASWVEYKTASNLNMPAAAWNARLCGGDPLAQNVFRHLEKLDKEQGVPAVLDYAKKATRLPPQT